MIQRRTFGAGLLAAAFARPALAADAGFRAFVTDQRTARRIPGLVAGVADASGFMAIATAGVADLEHPSPIAADARLHLGSMAKPMTATLMARLVEAGRLAWSSTPAQVWPVEVADMNPVMGRVTLEDLLRHRGGLAPFESDAEIARAPLAAGDGRARRAAFARWLVRRPPAFAPGAFHYSNAGYGMAAAMAEQVTGTTWEELMRRELFGPLGMTRSGFGWPPTGEARGHGFAGGRFTAHPAIGGLRIPAIIAPAVDVHCAMADLLAFGRAHLTAPPFLAPATWFQLHDGPIGGYTLGWNVAAFGVFHLGATGEFSGILAVSPGRGRVVAAVANAGGWPGEGDLFGKLVERGFADLGQAG